jgi:hypothetical protein
LIDEWTFRSLLLLIGHRQHQPEVVVSAASIASFKSLLKKHYSAEALKPFYVQLSRIAEAV